jgi:hypothetical protein
MNPVLRFFLFTVISGIVLVLTAWIFGNENIYTYDVENKINPIEAKSLVQSYDPERDYFRRVTLVKVSKPGSFPGTFERTVDTVNVNIIGRIRR